jgi:hypothetical protein
MLNSFFSGSSVAVASDLVPSVTTVSSVFGSSAFSVLGLLLHADK